MAITSTSPLDEPLAVLAAVSASTADDDGHEAGEARLRALKRIKNAIIGNTTRKLQLASRHDGVKQIVDVLKPACSEPEHPASLLVYESLAIVSSLAILAARRECLAALEDAQALHYLAILLSLKYTDPATGVRLVLATVRAVRSILVSTASLLDPFGSKASIKAVVLKSTRLQRTADEELRKQAHFAGRSRVEDAAGDAKRLADAQTDPLEHIGFWLLHHAQKFRTWLFYHETRAQNPYLPPQSPSNVSALKADLWHIVRMSCEALASLPVALKATLPTFISDVTPDALHRLFNVLGEPDAPDQALSAVYGFFSMAMKTRIIDHATFLGLLSTQPEEEDWYQPMCRIEDSMTHLDPAMRLAAVELIVARNLAGTKAGAYSDKKNSGPILATLLKLIDTSNSASIAAQACTLLGRLVDGNKTLQGVASNMDALACLRHLLERLRAPLLPYATAEAAAARSHVETAALLAISCMCMDLEDLRRKVLEEGLLPFIISALSSPVDHVRTAAAQCTKSLSRSINILKTALVDTNAAPALYELLSPSQNLLTQLAATAVMCNVFIEFSPLKNILLDMDGVVEKIVELTRLPKGFSHSVPLSDEDATRLMLRLYALATLKNLTYWSSSAIKTRTMLCMSWTHIVALLHDPDHEVRAEMLNILRNVACNEAVDIDLVVKGIGEARLYSLVEESLDITADHTIVLHALYLVANIATGTDVHKAAIMNRPGIIRAVHAHLSNPSSEIRVAAVWTIVNLCHRSDALSRRYDDYAHRLRGLGIEAKLREMREDPSIDVRERVRDALEGSFDASPGSLGMFVD